MLDRARFDPVLKDRQERKVVDQMPISEYFKGHGREVMANMRKKYGARAEEVFYATANKKKMRPEGGLRKKLGGKSR